MTAEINSEKVTQIKKNLENVHYKINQAAERAGRDANEIKLVAVTKQMPLDTIFAGIEAGIRIFGENYPEQAAKKIIEVGYRDDIEWHMIGHIQSRKSETVCQHFNMVHSLDRLKIARHLNKNCREIKKIMPTLVEVNVSGEDSKYGWPAWDDKQWPSLVDNFKKFVELEYIKIKGLMTMPPYFEDPEKTRPYYQLLKRLQDYLKSEMPENNWDELSIGTSFDYAVAIEEGATMIRLGTEIFGSRHK
jgi:PLP dependent protein